MDNKTLIANVGHNLNITQVETTRLLDSFVEVMKTCAEQLDSVSIPRFGTFETIKEDERVDIDLSTHRRVLLPPCITTTFKAGSALRKAATSRGKEDQA